MIGKYTAKVDDKGRLFVPAKLRGELGDTFYVTVGFHGSRRCLTAYTKEGWEDLSARYNAMSLSQKSGPIGFIFSNAVECTPDRQFRFLLSGNLFQYAGIDRDVVTAFVREKLLYEGCGHCRTGRSGGNLGR